MSKTYTVLRNLSKGDLTKISIPPTLHTTLFPVSVKISALINILSTVSLFSS